MSTSRVLQCGFPKSGNYGVYRLLAGTLRAAGRLVSYKQTCGLAPVIEARCADQILFPEVAEVDSFSFASGRCELEFPHPECRRLPVDPSLLFGTSTLSWTHDAADVVRRPELSELSLAVYVLRDGRDVIHSMAHHVVRPEMLRLHPDYRHRCWRDVYADLPLFERYARGWAEHVESYRRNRERFGLVRLETLMDDPVRTADDVASWLGVELDPQRLARSVSFAALAGAAPGHMRRGSRGEWRDAFRAEHVEIFKRVAGEALVATGYEKDDRW